MIKTFMLTVTIAVLAVLGMYLIDVTQGLARPASLLLNGL